MWLRVAGVGGWGIARRFAWLPGLAAAGGGCSGGADIHFVSSNLAAVDPPPATASHYQAQECYWWVDEAGELNVAMRCVRVNPFLGKLGRVELAISLALPGMPAGSGRNYRLQGREVRTVLTAALESHRFSSQGGAATVLMTKGDRVKGSFRIAMMHHPGLSLWMMVPKSSGTYLFWGTYEAVHDPERGQAIRAACEAGGWERPPPPEKLKVES